MAATLFYLDPLPDEGRTAVLDGKEGRHAATVRRIAVGERLVLSDGAGQVADVEVTAVAKDRLEALVLDRRVVDPPRPSVTVVQALPKSDRSELAVELATEAGADEFVPWQSARCVARWDAKADKGVAKWQAVATAAAKQSRRAHVPTVAGLHRTPEVVARVRSAVERGDVVAVLHESATIPFADLPVRDADSLTLIVGPEGGLDDAEVETLVDAGAVAVGLGPTVLRTSTAAAVALGAIGVLTDRWRARPLH
ncbi:16S rRNA (uracil1498-N3)-methyltransferase [Rhodococcus rhodochrous J3]|uniref:Ribosomal RNA small subunit methyltransferase E n=2 Tax=Rhodococcus rhodochrous TaxID=1829 RepID=A0AA47A399_RHORH|nr:MULTISPECIES: 16S rRNA (uracil(1498)-N(3))-methyltransferase [Rhodococcus]AYA26964.1 16S rRNA (uracil(1498)-N(3))-methyltransferase [Rhodococcus rhodochrous]MBF4477175.1 16S rRNA (uracil(1498)-N(3))-methyltransferase [Rhodococcus rhodochrous]MCB8909077.1 16S rRNA (uracil(1498)-N(3))-methyltransferase [Rhodococcus rhodochrous]MCD2096229.1 16S rRNA (uracil(1498)-N(3))-methyltransferase [Rhodococcus rhodochrous]MCD2120987.1 16S rRNA (uracil(1498)-N(3))-methyltransferase [Rhodococcus rhodochrou